MHALANRGGGVWWLDRQVTEDPLEDNELTFMCSEQTDFGVRGWNAFNFLRNSSTRIEIGASLLAMMPKRVVNIGIDSSSTIKKGGKSSGTQQRGTRRSLGTKRGLCC